MSVETEQQTIESPEGATCIYLLKNGSLHFAPLELCSFIDHFATDITLLWSLLHLHR